MNLLDPCRKGQKHMVRSISLRWKANATAVRSMATVLDAKQPKYVPAHFLRFSYCLRKLLIFIIVVFVLAAPSVTQAQIATYIYRGNTLSHPTEMPPSIPGATATVTLDPGTNVFQSATLSVGGYSCTIAPGPQYCGNLPQFKYSSGYQVTGWSWLINLPNGEWHFDTGYNWITPGGSENFIDYSRPILYSNTDPGTWTGPIFVSSPANLGGKSPQTPDKEPSSPVNPKIFSQSSCDKPPEPKHDCDVGNPINAATGNKFQVENDFNGAPAIGLALTRYYNSQEIGNYFTDPNSTIPPSPFGSGWRSTWHRSLIPVSSTLVSAVRADGKQSNFTSSAGLWQADPDVTSRLCRATDKTGPLATIGTGPPQ